jgi:hypothetical protein
MKVHDEDCKSGCVCEGVIKLKNLRDRARKDTLEKLTSHGAALYDCNHDMLAVR